MRLRWLRRLPGRRAERSLDAEGDACLERSLGIGSLSWADLVGRDRGERRTGDDADGAPDHGPFGL
ncbi:hypothetical protein GCM10009813_05320 [Brevibacterium marinum]